GGEELLRRLGRGGPRRSRPPARRAFIGRTPHLAVLEGAYATSRRDRTAVVAFVHGQAGTGKTALVRRFLEPRVDRESAVILAGRCSEQEAVAFKALDTLIDALSRHLRHLSRLDAERLMPRDVAVLARIFPVLLRVEAVAQAPQRALEIPDPQELRRRAFGALRELLARIGDRRPLILFIDDLQWGDLDSAVLLSELVRPPDAPALLLIGAYRGEDAADSPCLRRLRGSGPSDAPAVRGHDVILEPLTPEEGRDLALSLLGRDDPAARAQAEAIAREAAGSPGFISELVQYIKSGSDLGRRREQPGPITLDEVLWSRIRRLPERSRRLLEVLSVAGQRLRLEFAYRVAGLDGDGFAELDRLRGEQLVRCLGPGTLDDVEVAHSRIREAVLRHLPAPALTGLHRRLAEAWQAEPGADPEALAIHFEGAEQPERARRWYARAAEVAAESLAFDRAATLYRRALAQRAAGGDEARTLRSRLADALANAGRGPEAARAYQEAAAGADPAELIELQRRAAYQFLISGHIDEGLDAFKVLLSQVGLWLSSTPRRALLRMLFYRTILVFRGLGYRRRPPETIAPPDLLLVDISRSVALGISVVDVIRGANWQAQTLLRALRAGEPLRIALALAWEAVHSACQGRPTRRRTARLIHAAEALAQEIGHPHARGMATLSSGCAEFLEGRYGPALERVDRAAAILREQCAGVVWELDTAHIFGLWSLIYLGRLGELHDRARRLLQEARERGDRYLEATSGTYIAALGRLGADEPAEARRQADEAVRHWSQHSFHIQHLNRLYAHLYIDLYTGDAEAAWRRYHETRPVVDASLLLRVQQVRIDVLQLDGRCAVAVAAGAADPRPLLAAAE
ncbi:MAG TPA: AAA family ATPase, partial [Isosphaeraceae bacterium]